MKKCCEETTQYLTRLFEMDEWKQSKANMMKKYGKILSLPEMKAISLKEGKTLRDVMVELGVAQCHEKAHKEQIISYIRK